MDVFFLMFTFMINDHLDYMNQICMDSQKHFIETCREFDFIALNFLEELFVNDNFAVFHTKLRIQRAIFYVQTKNNFV